MPIAQGIPDVAWLIARPVAHRGLHDVEAGLLENTSSAFEAAIAADYAIECDLQLSGDGVPMVFHDYRLDRLTSEKGEIGQRTAVDLKKIRLKSSTDFMQTISELLHQVRGRVPLLIELKSRWNGNTALARRAIEALREYKGRFALMSFDPDLVEEVRIQSPQSMRGVVAERVAGRSWHHLPLSRRLELRHLLHLERTLPHYIAYKARDLPWPPVSRLRAAGLPVICWTVRSEAEAGAVRRYCDQITFEGFRP
jgi:glycerophosphoryl diester phosphodiesterase